MICRLCGETSSKIFRKKILDKYDVDYFQCSSCQFIQTEEPFWLKESYQNSINIEDSGLLDRNILFARRSATVLYFLFNKRGVFLDYGGGYGLFVRLMRDHGFDFYWNDPFTENLFARGFELKVEKQKRFELVTVFECFEHFVDPIAELERMLPLSDSLLFSTEIFSSTAPLPEEWRYYGFSHGQHVALYSLKSLEYIAKKYNMHLCTNKKSFHLLTRKKMNNSLFNFLLYAAHFGIPLIIRSLMHSKVNSDAVEVQFRGKT